jgi:hypothetical protein
MTLKQRPQVEANPDEVLTILRGRGERGAVWSSIAAELHGLPRQAVKIEHVRGVRDAVKQLVADGRAEEIRYLVFRACAA